MNANMIFFIKALDFYMNMEYNLDGDVRLLN